MSFTQATITHVFENADGTFASGAIQFTLTDLMTNGTTTLAPSEITANLSGVGVLSQALTSNVDMSAWSLSYTGSPTGGTFRLGWRGQLTSQLSVVATAAQVQAALNLIPGLEFVTCAGGPLGTSITISNVPGNAPFTVDNTLVSGAGSIALAQTATGTTPGSPNNTQWRVDIRIVGAKVVTYYITVPAGGGSVDLYSLIPQQQ
jgi:hypothetical protein